MSREIVAKQLDGNAKQGQYGNRSELIVSAFFKWLTRETIESVMLPANAFAQVSNSALDQ